MADTHHDDRVVSFLADLIRALGGNDADAAALIANVTLGTRGYPDAPEVIRRVKVCYEKATAAEACAEDDRVKAAADDAERVAVRTLLGVARGLICDMAHDACRAADPRDVCANITAHLGDSFLFDAIVLKRRAAAEELKQLLAEVPED